MGRFPNNRWNLSISAFWLVVMIVAVLATSNVSLGQSLNVQLQQLVDEALDRDLDGIIVYIDVAGSPSSVYSAGIQNRATAAPMDPNALFKIASISKLYIAAAAAILVDRDSLSLDDKLTDFFPELRSRIENADEITIRMLLKHRSGIPDFIREKDFPWADP